MIKQYLISIGTSSVKAGGTHTPVVELWIRSKGNDLFHTLCETTDDAAVIIGDFIKDHVE